MKLQEDIDRIKKIMKINTSNNIIKEGLTTIGPFKTDLENGPSNHRKRALGNWQSDNAWDLFAPPGSVVNSLTEGKVIKVVDNGKKSGTIYGTQITIEGSGDYPDIFYTHLKNVKLNEGQSVKVGDYIGQVSEWCSDESCTKPLDGSHVHIGLPYGKNLKDLIKDNENLVGGDYSSYELPSFADEILGKVISGITGID